MAETSNPQGIGLSEAQNAISAMLAPQEDNVEAAEAASEPTEELVENFEETQEYEASEEVDEEVTEYEEAEGEYDDQSFDIMSQVVALDGEEKTVEELKQGYLRQGDYTRKTQALAEERKAFDADKDAVYNERAQYAQLLPALAAKIESMAEPEPDWDKLYDTDPVLAQRAERKYNQQKQEREQQLAAIREEQSRVQREEQQRVQQLEAKYEAEQRDLIPQIIPEWRNQEVASQEALELRNYLLDQGFVDADIQGLKNAMLIKMARQSMLYERGTAKLKKQRVKPKASTKKPLRAGTSSGRPMSKPRGKAEIQRVQQTGRLQDGVAAIRKMLP